MSSETEPTRKPAHSFVLTPRHENCAVCERPKVYHTHEFVKGQNGEADKRVAIQPEGASK